MQKIAQSGITADLTSNTQGYIEQTLRPKVLDSLYNKTFKQLQYKSISKQLSNEIQKASPNIKINNTSRHNSIAAQLTKNPPQQKGF